MDYCGRKETIIINDVIFLLGTVMLSAAHSYSVLVRRPTDAPHILLIYCSDPACKKTEWWGAGVVICLERGADLHMAQLMLLPLTVSCLGKIQIGFTFLVPAHPGSPAEKGR